MKKITKQSWFVPAIVALTIVGVLTLYRNRDNLFGNSNEFGLTYIDVEKADEKLENLSGSNSENFLVVYGAGSCSACKTHYGAIRTYKKFANALTVYNIDIDKTKDDSNSFWEAYIANEYKYSWDGTTSDKFTDSPSTPVTILVSRGEIKARFSGAASSGSSISYGITGALK